MIRKRNQGWQVDVQWDGRRFRKTVPTEVEARALEAHALNRLKQGMDPAEQARPEHGVQTLEELRVATFSRLWKGRANERMSEINSKAVVDLLGRDIHPAAVTPQAIDKLVAELQAKGNSAGTINRKLACLSRILKFGYDRAVIDRFPRIERLREDNGRIRWYTLDEEERFLERLRATGRDDFADLVVFLLDTGCRASEAGRLRWNDYSPEERRITLWITKNGRSRAVPLPKRVHAVLERRRSLRIGAVSAQDLVFPGWLDKHGRSMPMTNAWRGLMEEIGVKDKDSVLHALRHTYASRLVQARVPLNEVQQLLGHGSPAMTQRYAHLAPANLVSAVAILDRVTEQRIKSA
jgi:integrase